MSKPPVIELYNANPLTEYYRCKNEQWDVARLKELAKDLPVFDCPLAALDLDYEVWSGCNIIELAEHCKKVMDCSLDYPIMLDWNGCIADGRHRIMKALIEGKTTIKAVRFQSKPEPSKTLED